MGSETTRLIGEDLGKVISTTSKTSKAGGLNLSMTKRSMHSWLQMILFLVRSTHLAGVVKTTKKRNER